MGLILLQAGELNSGGLAYEIGQFLAYLQQTFEGLPLWLQLLGLAVVVVALAQWTRGRYR